MSSKLFGREMGKRAVLGEVMITFVATVIIVFILVVFALLSSVVKTTSGSMARVDNEYYLNPLNSEIYNSYFANYGKLALFKFLLSEVNEKGEKLRGFDDAYDSVFGEVINVWTPAVTYAKYPDTCYSYKYLPKKAKWAVSNNKGESWMSLQEVIDLKLSIVTVANQLKDKNLEQGKKYLLGLQGVNGC